MFVKVTGTKVEKYPYDINDINQDFPSISLPSTPTHDMLASMGIYPVESSPKPTYDILTSKLVEGTPVYNKTSKVWVQKWAVTAATEQEIADTIHSIEIDIDNGVSADLNAFARLKGYQDIHTACSYALSNNPVFKADGEHCIQVRDITWIEVYKIIESGKRGLVPMPLSYDDIKKQLPPLEWPSADQ